MSDTTPDSPTSDSDVLVRGATPAAASGPEHVEVPVAYDAILLAGFGGPEGQDDVIPFLRNVTRGRGIPEERLEEVAHHYRHFGGVSPINAQNRALKAALEVELEKRGIDLPVIWGNRNWAPYMSEAVAEAKERGFSNLIAIATSAYSSFSSCRQYREDYAAALDATGLEGELRIDKVRQFFDHPGFVMPFVKAVHDGLEELQGRLPGIDLTTEVEVLFSTHSIPMADAERSGPHERHDDGTVVDVHGFGAGGAYEAQHLAVAEVVMAAATTEDVPWQLVYQSRSGPPTQPWLEPDINDAIAELPAAGLRVGPHGGHVGPRQRSARDVRGERARRDPRGDPRHRSGLRRRARRPRARARQRHADRGAAVDDGARPLVRRLPSRLLRERPRRFQARARGSRPVTGGPR